MPSPPAGDTKPCDKSETNSTTNPATETEPAPGSPTIIIRINPRTRDRLDSLKNGPEESYDSVISRLTDRAVDDEPLSKERH